MANPAVASPRALPPALTAVVRIGVVAALLLLPGAPVRSQQTPGLSVSQIVEMLSDSVPANRILGHVRAQGVAFRMDPSVTARLRVAGATTGLLDLLDQLSGRSQLSLTTVEDFVRDGIETRRVLGYATAQRVAFTMDAATTTRLRALGARDDLIEGLQRVAAPPARADPQRNVPSPTQPAASPDAATVPRVSRTRTELRREVYHRGGTVLRISAGSPSLNWVSDGVESPVPEGTSFGASISSAGLGLGLEGEMIRAGGGANASSMYLLGLSLEPFIPVGASRVRVIAGGGLGGFLHNQDVESVPGGAGGISSRVLGVALNGRFGLAVHPRPWFFVFGDANFRHGVALHGASFDDSGSEIWSQDWPDLSLSVRGWLLRVGLGF
jgi:hypothetical protein